jgi:hypothetical protein
LIDHKKYGDLSKNDYEEQEPLQVPPSHPQLLWSRSSTSRGKREQSAAAPRRWPEDWSALAAGAELLETMMMPAARRREPKVLFFIVEPFA